MVAEGDDDDDDDDDDEAVAAGIAGGDPGESSAGVRTSAAVCSMRSTLP